MSLGTGCFVYKKKKVCHSCEKQIIFVGRHAEGVTFFVFNLVKYWEGGVRVNSQVEVASGVPYVGKKPKYVTITFQASLVYASLCTLHV